MSRRGSGQASERVGQWASGRGKGGEQGERGERQQFLFSIHHHPNIYDFFLSAIAPFTGIWNTMCRANTSTVAATRLFRLDPIQHSFYAIFMAKKCVSVITLEVDLGSALFV